MHKVFEIQELVEHILDHLEDSSSSLARLARVCKAFWEPCARHLWYELPSGLQPLNYLMDLEWYPRPLPDDNHRSPTRIEMYASFIRCVFGTILPRNPRIVPFGYRIVDIVMPKYPVQFSLHTLAVGLETEAAVEAIDRLLSSSISDLEVFVPYSVPLETYLKFFHSLPAKIPDVKRLYLQAVTLEADDKGLSVQRDLIKTFVRFKHLQELHVPVEIGDELLSCLGTLGLAKLDIISTLRLETSPFTNVPRLPPVVFETLQSMKLIGEGYSCLHLMDRISIPVISSLVFHIAIFREQEIIDLCAAIARTTVRFLEIESLGRRTDAKIFPVACFAPLYRCTHLEGIQLAGGRPMKDRLLWNGEDISLMAKSWKQMEYLVLIPEAEYEASLPLRPTILIEDLLPLAEHCPNLSYLNLSVNLSGYHSPVPMSIASPACMLEELRLHPSSLAPIPEDMEIVANNLIALWPNLCILQDDPDLLYAESLRWFNLVFNKWYAHRTED